MKIEPEKKSIFTSKISLLKIDSFSSDSSFEKF